MKSKDKFFRLAVGLLGLAGMLFACAPAPQSSGPSSIEVAAGPTPVVVRILNLDAVLTVTPTRAPTATASVTPAPATAAVAAGQSGGADQTTPAAPEASPTPACTNQAELVRHLSISPNTMLKPGQYFAKVWQVKNVGTCTWDETYSLVFNDGEQMDAPASVPLAVKVAPGETIDIKVNIGAPILPGPYISNWLLQDPQGNRFGLAPDFRQPLQISISIQPPGPETPS